MPGLGRFHGEGNGNPPQYSCLGNPMDKEPGGLYSPWGHQWVGHDLATIQTEGSPKLPKGRRRSGKQEEGNQVDRSLSKLQFTLRAFFPNQN